VSTSNVSEIEVAYLWLFQPLFFFLAHVKNQHFW
jgi:hypothetical protein